jgi:hypothetical protein
LSASSRPEIGSTSPLRCARLFHSYQEVRGVLQQPRLGADDKNVRIDRILVPNKPLLDLGWSYGAVGVEGKPPGTKLGLVVSQCLDYGRAVWRIGPGDVWVMCPWIFIWHLNDFAGDIASVMAQHRIGGASTAEWAPLVFKTGGGSMLRVNPNGQVSIGDIRCGLKAGSR